MKENFITTKELNRKASSWVEYLTSHNMRGLDLPERKHIINQMIVCLQKAHKTGKYQQPPAEPLVPKLPVGIPNPMTIYCTCGRLLSYRKQHWVERSDTASANNRLQVEAFCSKCNVTHLLIVAPSTTYGGIKT